MVYSEVNTQDGPVEDTPDGLDKSRCCCWKRRWIVLTFILTLSLISVCIYLVYGELYKPHKENEVLRTYRALFLSATEVEELEQRQKAQVKVAPSATEPSEGNCSFTCDNNPSTRLRDGLLFDAVQSSTTIYHGCCETIVTYWDPKVLQGKNCRNCHLVHFTEMKQYFRWEKCMHKQYCSGCVCRSRSGQQVALVWKNGTDHSKPEDDYSLDDFMLAELHHPEASCKCENT